MTVDEALDLASRRLTLQLSLIAADDSGSHWSREGRRYRSELVEQYRAELDAVEAEMLAAGLLRER